MSNTDNNSAALTEDDYDLSTATVLEEYTVFGATLAAPADKEGEEALMAAVVVEFKGFDSDGNDSVAKVVMPMDAFPGFAAAVEAAIVDYQFGEEGSPLDR
jgi:hypothetical protein